MATITLKNIPDALYERLKDQARAHHRSINGELIHCLETLLTPKRITAEERVKRIREHRPRSGAHSLTDETIVNAIEPG